MKLSQLISNLLEKAGIDVTAEALKPVLSITTDIPDDISGKLESELITKEAAKSNVDLKNHFVGQYIKGAVKQAKESIISVGVDEEVVNKIFAPDSKESFTKQIQEGLKAAEDHFKKTPDKNKDSEKTFKEEIEKLQKQLSEEKTNSAKLLSEKDKQYESERINDNILSTFLTKSWSKHYPEDVRADLAMTKLKKEMEAKGISVIRDADGKTLKLVQTKNPEMDYFDSSNKKVTFTQLVDDIMSTNKFSAVSGDEPAATTSQVIAGQKPAQPNSTNSIALNLLRKSQADQAANAQV